ncbi:MAG: hypothetical protein IJV65_07115 [Kiritimatiellae bacterium]|nr:hypothetical protein [Kiritimatiellia bacterium]
MILFKDKNKLERFLHVRKGFWLLWANFSLLSSGIFLSVGLFWLTITERNPVGSVLVACSAPLFYTAVFSRIRLIQIDALLRDLTQRVCDVVFTVASNKFLLFRKVIIHTNFGSVLTCLSITRIEASVLFSRSLDEDFRRLRNSFFCGKQSINDLNGPEKPLAFDCLAEAIWDMKKQRNKSCFILGVVVFASGVLSIAFPVLWIFFSSVTVLCSLFAFAKIRDFRRLIQIGDERARLVSVYSEVYRPVFGNRIYSRTHFTTTDGLDIVVHNCTERNRNRSTLMHPESMKDK